MTISTKGGWVICVGPQVVSPDFTAEQTWALVLTLTYCSVDGIWIMNLDDVVADILERFGKERTDVWWEYFLDFMRKRYIIQIPSIRHEDVFACYWFPADDRLVAERFNYREKIEDLHPTGAIWFAKDFSEQLIETLDIGMIDNVGYFNRDIEHVRSLLDAAKESK